MRRGQLFRARRLRHAAGLVQAVPDDDQQVVKIKRFTFKPMPVDEAIMQMNMLGHDFYVFTNSESEQINVLYRRRDGGGRCGAVPWP